MSENRGKTLFAMVTIVCSICVLINSLAFAQPDRISRSILHITSTPVPAPDSDVLPTLLSLMSSNWEECQLPCWWGFQHGETTLDEITRFVEQNEFDRSWRESEIYSPYPLSNFIESEGLSFQFQTIDQWGQPVLQNFNISFSFDTQDQLLSTRIVFYHPSEWLVTEEDRISFLSLLKQIEETPDIYLFENIEILIPATENRPSAILDSVNPRFTEQPMIVVFPDQGVRVSYIFQLENDLAGNGSFDVETLRFCPDFEHTLSVEIRLGEVDDMPPDNEYYATPEEFYDISMSSEEFVDFFRENPEGCLNLFETESERG